MECHRSDLGFDRNRPCRIVRTNLREHPREPGLPYAALFCQPDVRDGGLSQFFWNSTGVIMSVLAI